MAGHTSFGWRNTCKRRFTHRRMAISAIDAKSLSMMFVAEHNGLIDWQTLTRHIGRILNAPCNKSACDQKADNATEAGTKHKIAPRPKRPSHDSRVHSHRDNPSRPRKNLRTNSLIDVIRVCTKRSTFRAAVSNCHHQPTKDASKR